MLGPVELIVAAFNEEERAEEVLSSLKKLDKENVIAILNAAIMTKNAAGKVRVHETEDVDSRRGRDLRRHRGRPGRIDRWPCRGHRRRRGRRGGRGCGSQPDRHGIPGRNAGGTPREP